MPNPIVQKYVDYRILLHSVMWLTRNLGPFAKQLGLFCFLAYTLTFAVKGDCQVNQEDRWLILLLINGMGSQQFYLYLNLLSVWRYSLESELDQIYEYILFVPEPYKYTRTPKTQAVRAL
ncbi:hypothetical protein METP3_02186 [Methanosarcinales archaeon]|nr:hypothetical protein METP3_02186 [Methanosarcinales archaeon]